MTDLTIPALDHGKIRVFSYAGPLTDDLRAKTPDALLRLFGGAPLNPDFIDIFEAAALNDMSIADYLQTGYDVTADAVDASALQALSGVVVLIMSRAHADAETTLSLGPDVTHVTTIGDGATLRVDPPLHSDAADGVLDEPPAPKRMSDARQSGMVATVALLVMFALVAVMVWIGG